MMFSVQRFLIAICISILALNQNTLAQAQTPRIRPQGVQRQAAPQRQATPQRQAGGRIVDARAQTQVPVRQAGPPKEFQLTPAQQKRVDDMLNFWEQKTSAIDTLSAKFGRWIYDPVFGPKDKDQAAKFSTGEIRYAAVDKGMIREDQVFEFDPAKAGQKSPFKRSEEMGEHWVCTGTSVYEYDHKAKKLNEIKLPKQMQGNAIAEGPLPFMFGAKAETIKKRYWIREIPQKAKGAPYHLEFLPKLPGENYSLIQIKLDSKKFLPTQMVLHELNKMGRSAYAFKDMQANSASHKVGNFLQRFIAPKVPRGYKLVVHEPPAATPQRRAQNPGQKRR